ncbi:MAG TPA: rod shape-determining protein MreC, partial [Patescibacteria group bacterium]|nr:rod shape-determining protein MreC [Patescibacteria group bacterium]
LVITHVNSEHPLLEGQTVTTIGDDRGMLPFLPIGTIEKVLSSASDPFQSAEVRIALHVRNGMPVSVLQNGEVR